VLVSQSFASLKATTPEAKKRLRRGLLGCALLLSAFLIESLALVRSVSASEPIGRSPSHYRTYVDFLLVLAFLQTINWKSVISRGANSPTQPLIPRLLLLVGLAVIVLGFGSAFTLLVRGDVGITMDLPPGSILNDSRTRNPDLYDYLSHRCGEDCDRFLSGAASASLKE